MPSCVHAHKHTPWPSAGPLTICPGERTCGYCVGKNAKFDHGEARNLRKHVYHEHTDGGQRDYGGVEVMMYRPWAQSSVNPHHISREEAEGKDEVSRDEDQDEQEREKHTATYGPAVKEEKGMVKAKTPALDAAGMAGAKSLALDGAGMAGAKTLALDGAAAADQKPAVNPKRWKSQAGKNSAAKKALLWRQARAAAAAVQGGLGDDTTARGRAEGVVDSGPSSDIKTKGWRSEAGKRSEAEKKRQARSKAKENGTKAKPEPIDTEAAQQLLALRSSGTVIKKSF